MKKVSSILKQLNQRPIVFFPIYRDLTNSCAAGILLSQLMYWFSIKDKYWKTDQELMMEAHLTPNELRAAKKTIKNLPFIKVTREGLPSKTWYEIDYEKFQKALIKISEINESLHVKSHHLYNTKTTTNNNNTLNSSPDGDKIERDKSLSQLHSRWKKFATRLIDAISRIKKVNYNSKASSWANQFRLLHERDKIDIIRIRTVLKWYCREMEEHDKYLPVAHSGSTFRKKFIRIEDAMNRKDPSIIEEAKEHNPDNKQLLEETREWLRERAKTEEGFVGADEDDDEMVLFYAEERKQDPNFKIEVQGK